MKQNYLTKLRSIRHNRQSQLAPTFSNKLIWLAFVLALAYILFAMVVHPDDESMDYHFYSERGLITALSAYLLAMAAAFTIGTITVHLWSTNEAQWPWIVMLLGFTFLCLDETAQFHERLGYVMHDSMDSGIFRNWNDVIVIVYGIVAIPIIAVLMPTIMKYRKTFEFFVAAFIFYFIHTLVDSISEPSTTLSIIVEESAKLFCGVALALAMYFSFVGALWNNKFNNIDKNQ